MRDRRRDRDVLEADRTSGGMLRSVEVGGLRVPAGPDSFLARKPWAVDLCRELGIGDELIEPRGDAARTCGPNAAWFRTRPARRSGSRATSATRSGGRGCRARGGVRALRDLVIARKRRDDGDESLGGLLRRRLGDEATDRAIAPLLAGLVRAAMSTQLSVRATFPELQRWERAQGSLLRGAQAAIATNARLERRPDVPATAGRGGATDRRARANELGDRRAHLGGVTGRERGDADCVARPHARRHDRRADAVVLTVDAPTAARLLAGGHGARRSSPGSPFVSTGVVLLVYPEGTGRASSRRAPASWCRAAPRR